MPTVKMVANGQIVIPAEMRKKYHIEPGMALRIIEYGGIICLIPPAEDPIKAAQESLPSHPSLSRQLLQERTNSRQ